MKKALTAVLGLAVATSIGAAAQAQDRNIELKFGGWVPPAHPLVPSTQQWGESITRASNGTIKVTVYPSEQLGKAADHYDMARDGIADITLISAGYQPGRFPILEGAALPFLAANASGGTRAMDEWYRKYSPREMRDVKVCALFSHDPGVLHTARKKVVKPEDLKGMKIRPAGATIANLVTMLGGTNVQVSAPESREVLERGVADGITFPWESIFLFRIDSVVKYHLDVPMYLTPLLHVMNTGKYNAMSPAQKKVIDDHCSNEWAEKVSAQWTVYEAGGRAKMMAAAGHDVYKLSDADLALWKKAVEPLTEKWADGVKKAGHDPKVVLDEFKAALKKHNAAY